MAKKAQPSEMHPTVRCVVTLLELAVTALLLWFPTMTLTYSEQLRLEVTASFFVENTAWEMPFSLLQIVFVAAWAAAVLPLFVKRIDCFWTMAVLGGVAAASFVAHLGLFVTCMLTVGERTYYGLTPHLIPTAAGVLYAVFGVFSLIETVCTCRALRCEEQKKGVPTEDACDDEGTV